MASKCVLIIEDEPDIVEILRDVVSDALPVALVKVASNGQDGLRLLEEERPDLVITDMKMPGISDTELLDAMAALPETRRPNSVLVFSGHENLEALRRQVHGQLRIRFVAKPCPVPELIRIVAEAAR